MVHLKTIHFWCHGLVSLPKQNNITIVFFATGFWLAIRGGNSVPTSPMKWYQSWKRSNNQPPQGKLNLPHQLFSTIHRVLCSPYANSHPPSRLLIKSSPRYQVPINKCMLLLPHHYKHTEPKYSTASHFPSDYYDIRPSKTVFNWHEHSAMCLHCIWYYFWCKWLCNHGYVIFWYILCLMQQLGYIHESHSTTYASEISRDEDTKHNQLMSGDWALC